MGRMGRMGRMSMGLRPHHVNSGPQPLPPAGRGTGRLRALRVGNPLQQVHRQHGDNPLWRGGNRGRAEKEKGAAIAAGNGKELRHADNSLVGQSPTNFLRRDNFMNLGLI